MFAEKTILPRSENTVVCDIVNIFNKQGMQVKYASRYQLKVKDTLPGKATVKPCQNGLIPLPSEKGIQSFFIHRKQEAKLPFILPPWLST